MDRRRRGRGTLFCVGPKTAQSIISTSGFTSRSIPESSLETTVDSEVGMDAVHQTGSRSRAGIEFRIHSAIQPGTLAGLQPELLRESQFELLPESNSESTARSNPEPGPRSNSESIARSNPEPVPRSNSESMARSNPEPSPEYNPRSGSRQKPKRPLAAAFWVPKLRD